MTYFQLSCSHQIPGGTNISNTDKLIDEHTRTAINRLLEAVLAKAREGLGDSIPNYKLHDDDRLALIRRVGEKIQFFVTDVGDALPEGRVDRYTDWVGFWNFAEECLLDLDSADRGLIEAALADRHWPNIRW